MAQDKKSGGVLRRVVIGIGVLLIVIAGGGLAAFQHRLALTQWGLDEAARHFGFGDIRFSLTRLELDGVMLSDIRLGPDVHIGSINVVYSPDRLMEARVDRVLLSDIDVDISDPEGGAIGRIRALTGPGGDGGSTLPVLPEISLRNLNLHGTLEGVSVKVIANADIAPDLSGTFDGDGDASYQMPDRQLVVKSVSLRGSIAEGASAINLKLKNANVTDTTSPPLFPPIAVSGSGVFAGTTADFSLSVQDRKKRFSSSLTGQIDMAAQAARVRAVLPDIRFSQKGLQPHHLSSLARLPFPISGTVGGVADLVWRDGKPDLKADLQINGGGVAIENTSIKGLKARLITLWPTPEGEAKISVHVPHAVARHDGMPFRIRTTVAIARINPETGGIGVTLPILRLRHMTKAPLFKPLRLRGSGKLAAGRVDFNLSAFLDKSILLQKILTAKGHHQLSDGSGEATLNIPDLRFTPGVLEPADIAAALDIDSEVIGQASADADVSWAPSGPKASARLRLTDLSISTDTLSVKNLNTELSLSSLLPLGTQAPQTVQAAEISSGIGLKNVKIRFSISNFPKGEIPALMIHNLNAGFIGGSVSIDDMLADPNATSHRLTLDLSYLNLEQVFQLIELEGVAGTGKLSGKLPMVISGDDIVISDGLLTNDAPGVLQFRSKQARQALAGGGEQVELLLRVLADFHYDRLSLKVGRQSSGNAHIGLHLGGHNPAIMDGHAFNLNINLEGNVDRLLETLLEGYRLSDRAIRATVGAAQK
jgi:hypothetical protein